MLKTSGSRQLVLDELVIPELKDMENTGRYDRNVLLWQQDAYLTRALSEHVDKVVAFHQEMRTWDSSEENRAQRERDFLASITQQSYLSARATGEGASLPAYVEAARDYYHQEGAVFARQLEQVAAHVETALRQGVDPYTDGLAREAYGSMARLSGVVQSLEGLGERAGAQQVARTMNLGIQRIVETEAVRDGRPIAVGRAILTAVNRISTSPELRSAATAPRHAGHDTGNAWAYTRPEREGRADMDFGA